VSGYNNDDNNIINNILIFFNDITCRRGSCLPFTQTTIKIQGPPFDLRSDRSRSAATDRAIRADRHSSRGCADTRHDTIRNDTTRSVRARGRVPTMPVHIYDRSWTAEGAQCTAVRVCRVACAADNNNIARWASGWVCCTLVGGRSATAGNIGQRRRACVCAFAYVSTQCWRACVYCVWRRYAAAAPLLTVFIIVVVIIFFFFLLLFSLHHLRRACVCLSAECSARHRPVHMR